MCLNKSQYCNSHQTHCSGKYIIKSHIPGSFCRCETHTLLEIGYEKTCGTSFCSYIKKHCENTKKQMWVSVYFLKNAFYREFIFYCCFQAGHPGEEYQYPNYDDNYCKQGIGNLESYFSCITTVSYTHLTLPTKRI